MPSVSVALLRSPCHTPCRTYFGPGRDRHLVLAKRRDSAPHPNDDDLVFVLMQMDSDRGVGRQVLGHHGHPHTWQQFRVDLDGYLTSVRSLRDQLSFLRVHDCATRARLRGCVRGGVERDRTADRGDGHAADELAAVTERRLAFQGDQLSWTGERAHRGVVPTCAHSGEFTIRGCGLTRPATGKDTRGSRAPEAAGRSSNVKSPDRARYCGAMV